MRMSRMVVNVTLAGLLAAYGCEQRSTDPAQGRVTSEDIGRDVEHAVETAVDFSQQTKKEFQKTLASRLQDLDAEIASLREKGSNLKDEAKSDWERKMAELDEKRETLCARLTEVSEATAEAWKDVKQGVQSAWEDLDKSYRKAAREFESSPTPN